MKPGTLLLLLGSMALWTGLPAAPLQRASGQPPLPPSGAPGEAAQDKISQTEEAKPACLVAQEPEGALKSPLPQGKRSEGHGETEAEEPQPGKEGSLCPEGAGLESPPGNNMEVESSGGPRPTENPLGASEKGSSLDPRTPLGGAPVQPSSLGRLKSASRPALPNLETWNPVWDPRNVATSGGKPNTSEKPTSSTPGDKATPGTGKAPPTEKPVPGSAHPTQDKPKPASAAGHHLGPTSGEKPAPNSGPEAHGRPAAGEKPTSSEKPEDGEKPEAEKESKPEKEAEEGKKTEEEEEEEGLFDEEEEEEEGEKGTEKEGGTPEGSQDGDDAFDKELDYGLNKPPFDAYSYHDGWSEEGAEEADPASVGEMAALPQAGGASNDGEPTFDAWGDLVGGTRP